MARSFRAGIPGKGEEGCAVSSRLEEAAAQVRQELDRTDAVREKSFALCRQVVRDSASAIRLVHRERFAEALELIEATGRCLGELGQVLQDEPLIAAAGFVLDAQREFVESYAVWALATGAEIPTAAALGVRGGAYLCGLAEAAMELRRRVVDLIRVGDTPAAEAGLKAMDEIYSLLCTFDYPEAISLGLKRRLDTLRSVVERTRHDITTAARQDQLVGRMGELESQLDSFKPQISAD